MTKRKSILQKSSGIVGKVCFLLAIVCAVTLYFKVEALGMQNPVSASFLASSFFFVFIGFVFTVMANADLPSFDASSISKNEDRDHE